jgi:hypothetical protein
MVEKWHVQEGDILQPGVLMVSLGMPPGFFDIPTPPKVTVPLPVEGTVMCNGALYQKSRGHHLLSNLL